MKKKTIPHNPNKNERGRIEDCKKEENKIRGAIAILVIIVLVFVLTIAYFNEIFDSFIGVLIPGVFILLFIIIFGKTFCRILKVLVKKIKSWDFIS